MAKISVTKAKSAQTSYGVASSALSLAAAALAPLRGGSIGGAGIENVIKRRRGIARCVRAARMANRIGVM